MELARIVLVVEGDHALFIRRSWLTKIFVTGDVLSFLIQSGGKQLHQPPTRFQDDMLTTSQEAVSSLPAAPVSL
jgi:hypothetical protein